MSAISTNLVDGGSRPMVRVRALRAPAADPVHHCLHCGAPLKGDVATKSGFCCSGCNYVHRLVHDHGLDGYYKIRDAVVAPVDQTVFQARDFSWLAELQTTAEKSPGTPELELEVQGISCAGCVWLIERLFHQQPGALHIEADAQAGRLRLRWTTGKFDAPAFAKTLHSFNYLLGPAGEAPAELESRRLVRRIGLCAAFSMNVMLFTLPVYFGMTKGFAYARLFGLLSMGFATFSLLTGGFYFLNRAVRALRDGVLHIDLPIAVGIAGAYLGSVYGWFTGQENLIYFDFVSAFILLMLTGRWAQTAAVERNRHRLLRTGCASPRRVWIKSPDGISEGAIEELKSGDVFVVRSGQIVPVESQLMASGASFGTAWITGEAEARSCREGARVPAGAINLERSEISLRANEPWSASMLAELLRPGKRDLYRHAFLEKIIRGYLVGIFVIATLAGIAWWLSTRDAGRTWSVVTAVLVVSCPCALGLAFPLTDEMATMALRKRGVFVRENDLWPRLARVRKIIFDKTGTLTFETPVLVNPEVLAALAREARAALMALVQDNPHPVGQSLYETLLSTGIFARGETAAGEFSEHIGHGVVLKTAAHEWSLGRPQDLTGVVTAGYDVEFACDSVALARFKFSDQIRSGAREDIAALQRRGFAISILSGDSQEKVAAIAVLAGVAAENAIAGKTPAEKAAWVRSMDRCDTLMVGDGANDSLAFDAAWVRGTPVIHRGVLEKKSDFYYLGRDLAGLRALFEVAARRRRMQRWLLGFSIAYNLLAVGLAVVGHMNPLIAAILMPGSSLTTLAISVAGMTSQHDSFGRITSSSRITGGLRPPGA